MPNEGAVFHEKRKLCMFGEGFNRILSGTPKTLSKLITPISQLGCKPQKGLALNLMVLQIAQGLLLKLRRPLPLLVIPVPLQLEIVLNMLIGSMSILLAKASLC